MAAYRMRVLVMSGLLAVPCSGLGAQTAEITGTVKDEVSGRPISAVSVIVNDTVIAVSDRDGMFRLERLAVGDVTLTFRRIGFAPTTRSVRPTPGSSINIVVVLRAVPTTLQEIVVEGEAIRFTNPGLVGFYERRQGTTGRFLTESEIVRGRSNNLGYFLGPRGLRVPPQDLSTPAFGRSCLVAYLDGMRTWDFTDINRLIKARQTAGLEFHPELEVPQLPPEFIPFGPHCGVVIVWTREPRGPSAWAVGFRVGMGSGSDVAPSDVGGHLIMALSERFALRIVFEGTRGNPRDRWRAMAAISVAERWLYGGAGVMTVKERMTNRTRARGAAFVGAGLGQGALVPFVEARVDSNFSDSERALFLGLTIQFRVP